MTTEKDKRLQRALNHLRTARSQFIDSDDEIIRDHVETAILLLEGRDVGTFQRPEHEDAEALIMAWRKMAGSRCVDAFVGPCLNGGYKCRLVWGTDAGPQRSYLESGSRLSAIFYASQETPWPLSMSRPAIELYDDLCANMREQETV